MIKSYISLYLTNLCYIGLAFLAYYQKVEWADNLFSFLSWFMFISLTLAIFYWANNKEKYVATVKNREKYNSKFYTTSAAALGIILVVSLAANGQFLFGSFWALIEIYSSILVSYVKEANEKQSSVAT